MESPILTKYNALPSDLKKEAEDFIEFLIQKSKSSKERQPKKRPLGLAKGLIKVAPDFDEPMDDFKDYM